MFRSLTKYALPSLAFATAGCILLAISVMRSKRRSEDKSSKSKSAPNGTSLSSSSVGGESDKVLKCFHCWEEGHVIATCPKAKEAICSYCHIRGHVAKSCPEFQLAKSRCTSGNYVSTQGLNPLDSTGCCAAGVYAYYVATDGVKYVLMAQEERQGKLLMNFLGGRRNTREETPKEIASREVLEETTTAQTGMNFVVDSILPSHIKDQLVSDHNFSGHVYWTGYCKYALYPFKMTLTPEEANDIVRKDRKFDEIKCLKWVTLKQLKQKKKYHQWVTAMISDIDSQIGLDQFV
jgi:8-oxo-dGTP pyrophosphatase MutT (NUDIX family)